MAQDLTIRLLLDKKIADQESQEFHKAEKARIAKSLSDAEVAERAKTAFIQRENRQRIQEAAQAQKTTVEQSKALEKEAAAEKVRIAKEAEKAAREAAKARAEDERQWSRRSLTDAEVNERAKTAILLRENKDRVTAVVAAHDREKGVVGDLRAAWDTKVTAIKAAGTAAVGFGVAMTALRAGTAILDALDEKYRNLAASANESTKAVVAHHKAQLELAGFSGNPGQTGPELAKTVALSTASGLTIGESTDLRREFGAKAYSILDRDGREGLMSQAEGEKSQVLAAKFGAVMGGNPADYGKAAALIPALMGKRMTADEVGSELVRMDKFATIGGYATPSGMTSDLEKSSGYIKSGVIPMKDAEALLAIDAKVDPNSAATTLRQTITAMSTGAILARGGHVDDEFKEQSLAQSAYFKRAGILPNMGVIESLKKLRTDITGAAAAAKAKGETFNADQYLLMNGMLNQDSRMGVMAFAGEGETWDREIENVLNQNIAPDAIDKMHGDFQKTEVGRQRMVDVGRDVATAVEGQRHLGLNQQMEMEFNRLKLAGKNGGDLKEYMAPDSWWPDTGRMIRGTGQNALMGPVAERLDAELKRNSLPAGIVAPDGAVYETYKQALTSNRYTMGQKADLYNSAVDQIGKAGGDTTLGGTADMRTLSTTSQKQLDVLERIENELKQQRPQPLAPPPPGRPTGNNGAPRAPSPNVSSSSW